MRRGRQSQLGQHAPFQLQGVVDQQCGGVVGTDGPGKLPGQLRGRLQDARQHVVEARHERGDGEAEGDRHRVLAVGSPHLQRRRLRLREIGQAIGQIEQQRHHHRTDRSADAKRGRRVLYVERRGSQVYQVADRLREPPLQHVHDRAQVVARDLLLGVHLRRVDGCGRRVERLLQLRTAVRPVPDGIGHHADELPQQRDLHARVAAHGRLLAQEVGQAVEGFPVLQVVAVIERREIPEDAPALAAVGFHASLCRRFRHRVKMGR